MKKYLLLLFILVIFICSCEDDLNPFVESEDTFILNCVLKNDRSFQTALFSKSYFVDNFDPSSNTDDHSIKDAYIRIFFKDSVKIFNDTLMANPSNSSGNITSYFHNNFVTKPNTEYFLEAILKDGRKISAKTTTPEEVDFNGDRDNIIPPEDKNFVRIGWERSEIQQYTAARFKFVYTKNEDGNIVRYEKEIPRKYALVDGEMKPFYPEPSYDSYISVEMNSFNKALEEISEGDDNKSNYTVYAFILEILVYDSNLTAYYASKSNLGESFSITVSENDYSNIVGGRGIFGSFIKQRSAIKFSGDYIRSFGYTPGLTGVSNE